MTACPGTAGDEGGLMHGYIGQECYVKWCGLSPQEGDPPPQVQQAREGGRHVGQCGGGEDTAGPLLVFWRQVVFLPEYWHCSPEAGIPLDRKRDKVDQRGDSHRGHPGNQDNDTRHRGLS